MAGTIGIVAGAAEVFSPPVGPSARRSGVQHAENRGVPDRIIPGQPAAGPREKSAPGGKGIVSTATLGQNTVPSHKTMLIFERDGENGKMYVYIRDKRTGEEVIRIPSKLLDDAEPQPASGRRVDIRI